MEVAFQSGFASATLQVLFQKFADFASREIGIIFGADARLRKLQRTLARIQAMVEYVEDGHVKFPNNSCKKAWNMWLRDLNKLCYDADDLLDELSLQLPNFEGIDQVNDLLRSTLNISVPRKIEDICGKLEDMEGEMNGSLMNEIVHQSESSKRLAATSYSYDTYNLSYSTGSLVDQGSVFGRHVDVECIIGMLLDFDPVAVRNNVSVIPITGMAGVGKTTLAQVVYNSEVLGSYFNMKMWVYASIEFDVTRIMKMIIESILEKPCELSNLSTIQGALQNLLRDKRFLLVLDDVWSDKDGEWEVLSLIFRFAERGSKVVVTTRNLTFSSIVGTHTTQNYDLQLLSDEDCWEVMRRRAFSNVDVDEHESLEQLGRDIARKCKGLPLAAKTLGSILQATPHMEGWRLILESELWELPQEKNDCIPALALSYCHLPAHLKKCFAYCSIFPQNHMFEGDDLVLLWIAEGFVEPIGNRRLEDIGRDYLTDLLRRSLFQCVEGNYSNPTKCKMHDLIHGMAKAVSTGICFQMVDGNSQWYPLYKDIRYLALIHGSMGFIEQRTIPSYQSLRTFILICRGGTCIRTPEYNLLLKFRSLRVLNLSNAGIEQLPDSIDHLKHLRYLNLSQNGIQRLPRAISKLFLLQTLKLIDCPRFLELPMDLKNLIDLRHLQLNTWRKLNSMPSNLGRLTNLQTLAEFIVGSDEGYDIAELEQLSLLKGSLCIRKLENVRDMRAAKKANLSAKPYLNKLELQWSSVHGNRLEVLEGLEPHEYLKELVITNYCGAIFPDWLSKPQYKFTSIRLRGGSCSILPSFGELPLLKSLHIEEVASLVQIDHTFCRSPNSIGFRSLKSLKFQNMPQWSGWHGIGNDLPVLHNLTFEDCPVLIRLPDLANLRSLQELNFIGCPELGLLPQLPDGICVLIITDCAVISARCQVDQGLDWPMIRAIPRIEIDGERIQPNAQVV